MPREYFTRLGYGAGDSFKEARKKGTSIFYALENKGKLKGIKK